MPGLPYYIEARDAAGAPLAGLKPTWQFLESPERKPVTPPPPIAEVEPGLYVTMIDPASTGEAVGRVDLGATAAERYHTVAIYRTDAPSSPVVTPAAGPLTLDATTVAALARAVAAQVTPPTADQVAAAVVAALPAPATTPQETLDALTAAAKSLADLAGKLGGNPGKGNKG